MRLYILRHGESAGVAASDSERPLTDLGRQQTKQVAEQARERLPELDAVLVSPKLRARQTCEIACSILEKAPEITTTGLLKPNADVEALGAFLEQREIDSALLVSHQPLAGRLLEYLTDKPGLGPVMGTSCLAALNVIAFSRGCGALEWLEAPP